MRVYIRHCNLLYIVDLILTTILQEILQKYTARQLRLAFLTQLWNSKVDFSESLMTGEVRNIEASFNVSDPNSVFVVPPLNCRFLELFHYREGSH